MSSQMVSLVLCALLAIAGVARSTAEPIVHKRTFLSAPFELGPGDVTDRYDRMDWPEGHIGLRDFWAEVVDEKGNPVPLTDVYLHHWTVLAFPVKKGFAQLKTSVPKSLDMNEGHRNRIPFQDAAGVEPKEKSATGSCYEDEGLNGFGAGSETRKTKVSIPAPYAQGFGSPADIPEGYEQAVYLNIHAIDTRGAVSKTNCLECVCESYGVTKGPKGHPLKEGYLGGMYCCYDKTHCAVQEGFQGERKTYFLKYILTWVDWDSSVISARSYSFDITDDRTSLTEKPKCLVEYTVPKCDQESAAVKGGCIDRRYSIGAVPIGGDLIQVQMHQHVGAIGGMIYYKNGPLLCLAEPIYGHGTEPGDEAGYVVGITSCYPEPGSVKLESMKEITFEAWYNNEKMHTGAMSLFSLVVADPIDRIREVTDPSL